MATIPSNIQGVQIEFAGDVLNNVHDRVVEALKHCVAALVSKGIAPQRLYVSSAYRPPTPGSTSRHGTHKAVDISRVDGKRMATDFPGDPTVKKVTIAIQEAFETYAHRRENFGPHKKLKLGQPYSIGGHHDHVHLSVN